MIKNFCDLCKSELTDIIGAGKLIYFERVSSLGKEAGVENRVNKVEVDICAKCNESILNIVKGKQKK